jgi:hypothetical protein
MTPQFKTFSELLLHCFKCRDAGDSRQALEIVDDYLSDPQAARPHDTFWSEQNIQQALGSRIAFIQDIDPAAVPAAERRHLDFCEERLRYWLSATADSSARLGLAHFVAVNPEAGTRAIERAIRVAGLLGTVSPGVAEAAAKARENQRARMNRLTNAGVDGGRALRFQSFNLGSASLSLTV